MRFGIVSDPHVSPPDAEPYVWHNTVDLPRSIELLDGALDWLKTQSIDTLVLLGDLTEAADVESFAVVRERALAFGVPVLALPGNCDVDPVDRSVTAFEQVAGHEVTIAPAILLLRGGMAIELIGLEGVSESERLRGVRASPASSSARIVLTHYPVLNFEAELAQAGFKHSGNLTNRAEIEDDMRASGAPTIVIHGHLHMHDARISRSLLHLSCAALIEPPHHVSVIDIDYADDHLAVSRYPCSAGNDAVDRLPVFAPERQRWVWEGDKWRVQSPF